MSKFINYVSEARGTTPAANIFGGMISYGIAGWKNDLLLISETENRPCFDLSIADIASWQPTPALQLGAGVNFYRVLPRNQKSDSPRQPCTNAATNYVQIDEIDNEVCFIQDTVAIDPATQTARVDTVYGSLSGTKLMGRFRFDPKAFFPSESFGAEDLKLYAEIAVIGLDGSKAYKAVYGDLRYRLPVMAGFNFPVFHYLEHLSLEVERYGSRVKDDLG